MMKCSRCENRTHRQLAELRFAKLILWVFAFLVGMTMLGCTNKTVVPDYQSPVYVPAEKKLVVPEDDLKECPPLSQVDSQTLTDKQSLQKIKQWSNEHDECSRRFKTLADIVRELIK